MLSKCPNCKREIESPDNSVLVMCKCGDCAYERDVESAERRLYQNGK